MYQSYVEFFDYLKKNKVNIIISIHICNMYVTKIEIFLMAYLLELLRPIQFFKNILLLYV